MGSGQEEVALELCKRRGALIASLDETDGSGDTPMVAAGAKGDVTNLKFAQDKKGDTCLHLCVGQGHTNLARYLCEVGGKRLVMMVSRAGWSCAHSASSDGHIEALRVLCEVGGKDLLLMVNKDGWSCAYTAARNGHVETLRVLLEVGGKELLLMVSNDGFSCAHAAAFNGHVEALRVLWELGGKELLFIPAKIGGFSCVHAAAVSGQIETLRVLCEMGGKELLLRVHKDGFSCAHAAAQGGQVEALRVLIEHGGRELLMMVEMKTGASVLSRGVGHSEVCRYIAREGGADLVGIADSGGWTVLHRLLYQGDEDLACEFAGLCGKDGQGLLDAARKEVVEGTEKGTLCVFRGWPSTVRMDAGQEGGVSVSFGEGATVRSRGCCPVGSKAYYELEIVVMPACPQFGFATGKFEPFKGHTYNGVGADSVSWAVDGRRNEKWHNGRMGEYDCAWQEGDVIGLGCDLVKGRIQVSVNGDFSGPNGLVFDIDAEASGGLFAAFTGDLGQVRCNLGEAGFKHLLPSDEDGGVYVGFAELGSA